MLRESFLEEAAEDKRGKGWAGGLRVGMWEKKGHFRQRNKICKEVEDREHITFGELIQYGWR